MADPVENKPKLGELPSLLNDIKEVVFERIRNPFLASFSVFWLIFNWKIPFYLFLSNDQIEMRFTVISKVYSSWGNSLLYPFLFALGYIYLKDHFLNYLESTSNHAFLKQKKTEIVKTIGSIRLEKDKIDALNELQDAKDRNKFLEEIKRLQTVNTTLNDSKVENKAKIDFLNSIIKSVISIIELDFYADSLDVRFKIFN